MTMEDTTVALTEKLVQEGLDLGIQDVAKMYGGNCHKSTVQRHIDKGFKRRNGAVVKLEAVCIGGSYRTSRQAVLRFLAALTAKNNQAPATVSTTPSQHNREAAKASAELEAILGTN